MAASNVKAKSTWSRYKNLENPARGDVLEPEAAPTQKLKGILGNTKQVIDLFDREIAQKEEARDRTLEAWDITQNDPNHKRTNRGRGKERVTADCRAFRADERR